MTEHKLNTDKTVAVSTAYFWQPINSQTPRGVKMLLISKPAGVAVITTYDERSRHWTHWAPLPKWAT